VNLGIKPPDNYFLSIRVSNSTHAPDREKVEFCAVPKDMEFAVPKDMEFAVPKDMEFAVPKDMEFRKPCLPSPESKQQVEVKAADSADGEEEECQGVPNEMESTKPCQPSPESKQQVEVQIAQQCCRSEKI
jgi:hypothetical protein